jgi:protein O-mannosyl-transferase
MKQPQGRQPGKSSSGTGESSRAWWDRDWLRVVVWFYLGKLLWPHPLIYIYPKWESGARQLMAYLPLAIVLAAVIILWVNRERWSRGSFMAFVYFLAALLPVLGLLNHYFVRYSFVGDHFQYLASIGPLALAGAGISGALTWAGIRGGLGRLGTCGLVLGVLGILTWQHARVFRDNETLWQDTRAKNPDCWMACCNLGAAFGAQGKLEEGIQH